MFELLMLLCVLPGWIFSVIGAVLSTIFLMLVAYWWQILAMLTVSIALEVLWEAP